MNIDGRPLEGFTNANRGLPRVRVWDLANDREGPRVDGGPPTALSSDGALLATGDRDWKNPVAKVWDTATGRLVAELKGREPGVFPLEFSPDARFLFAGGFRRKTLWRLADGASWDLPGDVSGMPDRPPRFSRDGRLLLPYGLSRIDSWMGQKAAFACWDVSGESPRPVDLGAAGVHGDRGAEPLMSPELGLLAVVRRSTSGANSNLSVLEIETLREIRREDLPGLLDAEFTPDGRRLSLVVGRTIPDRQRPSGGVLGWVAERVPWFLPYVPPLYVRELRLTDPVTGEVLMRIEPRPPTWGNFRTSYSADGRTVAVSYVRGESTDPGISDRPATIEVWDIPPGRPLREALALAALLTAAAVGMIDAGRRWLRHPA